MRIQPDDAIALKTVIESDLEAIARINAALSALADRSLEEAEVVSAAYHLHNAYNALENSFDQTSRTFENHVKDLSRWHQELLKKMFLDMSPLRPALLRKESQAVLEDLCAFRHLFRHSYASGLDPERVRQLAKKWLKNSVPVLQSLQTFADLLAQVVAESDREG